MEGRNWVSSRFSQHNGKRCEGSYPGGRLWVSACVRACVMRTIQGAPSQPVSVYSQGNNLFPDYHSLHPGVLEIPMRARFVLFLKWAFFFVFSSSSSSFKTKLSLTVRRYLHTICYGQFVSKFASSRAAAPYSSVTLKWWWSSGNLL